jgi:hypothetical protein
MNYDPFLVYKPPISEEKEAKKATVGVKFSNDIFLTEAWLINMNVGYTPEDLENTPMGMCHRIKVDKKDLLKEFPEKRQSMDTLKNKRALIRAIRNIIDTCITGKSNFPHIIEYRGNVGDPLIKFTIEMREDDFFIDEKGQKWVKAQ